MTQEEFRQEEHNTFLFALRDLFKPYLKEQSDELGRLGHEVLTDFIENLKIIQAEQSISTASIHISLLYTGFLEKKLWFQIAAYGEEGHFIGVPQLTKQINALDLSSILPPFLDDWSEKVQKEGNAPIITPSFLEHMVWGMISPLFRFFITEYRYSLEKSFEKSDISSLSLSPTFYVNLGELGGWGKMIYGIRPLQDLLEEEDGSLWDFSHYEDKIYENQVFDGLKISWGTFKNCKFQSCEIKNFTWTDCKFENCTFYETFFRNGSLYGAAFMNCTILKSGFEMVNFYQIYSLQKNTLDRYHSSKMEGCHFSESKFTMCHLDYTKVSDCKFPNTIFDVCVTKHSPLDEVNYLQMEQGG